jgi:signal transduction histidine kinase
VDFNNMPVQRKLMTIILIVSGTVSLAVCATLLTYDYQTFRQNTRQTLTTLGQIIATNSTAALAFQNPDDAREILSALKAERHIVAAALYDGQGRLFVRYPAARPETNFPSRPAADGYHFAAGHLAGYEPVAIEGRRLGTLYIESDMDALYARLRVYGGLIMGLAGLGFLLAFTLTSVLQRGISRPILALAVTAETVSRGDYSVRATKMGGGEPGLLTDAFNHMLEEIQKLNEDLEQRVIRRTSQLQAVNKELEAFSYSVSHDLRAPLRHIDGFAQLLQRHLDATLDDTGRRYLATIADSAKRLGRLIDELLVFSRMGRTEIRQSVVPLGPLVAGVIRELQPETGDRQIEWVIGELPAVEGDPAMLRQVWVNLLSNAVKYSRRRPQARIEISHRHDPADGEVFAVHDNGAGFDMKYVDKLFGVFQRLHSAAEFEGTGIGLANVQRIVVRHGGRVWAEGRPEEGATFYFTVPGSAAPVSSPLDLLTPALL